MRPAKLKVGLVQQAVADNDKATNWNKSAEQIAKLAAEGCECILLQELHSTLYFCQQEDTDAFDLAEPIPGPATEFFGELAEKHNIVLVTSLFEKRGSGLYHNTAVVFDRSKEIAGKYRKMHIPDDPGFYEKFYFTPGDMGFPTAIGWDLTDTEEERTRQHGAWETIQRSHAVANSVPVIVANRTGFEASPVEGDPGIQFWGQSFVAGPQGEILAKAEAEGETTLTVELDMERTEQVKRIWPYFRTNQALARLT